MRNVWRKVKRKRPFGVDWSDIFGWMIALVALVYIAIAVIATWATHE